MLVKKKNVNSKFKAEKKKESEIKVCEMSVNK